jgi:glycosyltransferase involved in cell wall biosynthesis
MKVSLLTGGSDKTYALGLLASLIEKGIEVDFIGSDELNDENILSRDHVNFFNLWENGNPDPPFHRKIARILKYYFELIQYSRKTDSKLFHILWLNKFPCFDRTLLNTFYKVLRKKLVFTAHNIDQQERDGKSTLVNRISLKYLYRIVDHIFVHTEKMKRQLVEKFEIRENKITVIPFGINNMVPVTNLKREEAKKRLGLDPKEKTILFFGRIAPYKGLELLIPAFEKIVRTDRNCRLIIAGQIKEKHLDDYWKNIQESISERGLEDFIIQRIEYIPDEEIELYYKSADVLILPYKHIFQTGVLFIAYYFGLPVIATDVGSFREDIAEGKTGFLCKPDDPVDLSDKIAKYFQSDLYQNLEENRFSIKEYAARRYSWERVSEETKNVYKKILEGSVDTRSAPAIGAR